MAFEYKGYLTQKQEDEDFLTHGEIISFPFGEQKSGNPFAIIAISKVDFQDEPVLNPALMIILDAQFIADENVSPFPLCKQRPTEGLAPEWSERNFIYLPSTTINNTVLANYRLFWKGGKTAPKSV